MKPVEVLPAADADIDEQADYYLEAGGVELAMRFYHSIEATLDRLTDFPESAPRTRYAEPELAGARFVPVDGFDKSLIFFRDVGTSVQVIRVLHGSRDIEALLEQDRG